MSKTIEFCEADREKYQTLTMLLELEDLDVVGNEYDDVTDTQFLCCVHRWDVAVCPHCAHLTDDVHDYPKQRQIHDAPIRGQKTMLLFDSRRFNCKRCKKQFTPPVRDVVPECTYTYRLEAEIGDPSRKQDVGTIAQLYGVGYKLVERIILQGGEKKENERRKAPLSIVHLGIDELSQKKGHGNYVLVLTDLKRRIVIDVLQDRRKQTLINWLKNPPEGIKLDQLAYVATDLWTHYRDGVHAVFPHVSIVADRFHVVQNLHDVIHEERRKAQKEATTDEEKATLKGLRYLLLKNEQKLTDNEKERLEQLKNSHPSLYQLCLLRQQLHEWYELRTIPEFATVSLNRWIETARQLGMTSLNRFCQTLKSWQTEIVNFFDHRITSGFVEGMNSKIRVLKRIAFGIPNFDHFRLRVLGFCG